MPYHVGMADIVELETVELEIPRALAEQLAAEADKQGVPVEVYARRLVVAQMKKDGVIY